MARGLLSAALALAALPACPGSGEPPRSDLTTDTDSAALGDAAARTSFLVRYLRPASPLVDADFTVRYRDNGGGWLPGPSDWEVRAVLELMGDAAAWHLGWRPCAPSSGSGAGALPPWAAGLLARRPGRAERCAAPSCWRAPAVAAVRLYVCDARLLVYAASSAAPGPD